MNEEKQNQKRKYNSTSIGKRGEEKACNHLINNGYTIVERDWRTLQGEIDIIAEKKDVLIFFEVKTVPNSASETLELILGKIKQKKIVETAKRFLNINRQYKERYIRFDVLIIDMHGLPPVYHIQSAFSESI